MDELQKLTEQLRLAESQLARLDQGTSAYNRKLKEVERLSNQASAAFNSQTGSMLGLGRAYDTIKSKIIEFGNVIAAEAKALDNTTIEFQRQTAASEELAENIGRLTDNLALFGVSLADAAETVGALTSTFTEFTQMNQVARNELGATVALLNEVGISAASSAKIFESSTKTLGMSVDETADMLITLRAAATALGVPVEQLTQDFIGAEEMLAKLGRTGPDTFKQLAAQAKATGVELSKITAIAEKFDTFESAASAAQGLNAVLGGNFLDSLYMIEEVDPAKRFLAIRDAIFAAGYSAESLADSNNYYLKKSLAATLGIPVSDFMKMLTGNVNELTGEVMAAASSLEELREQAFKMKGFDEIVDNVFGQLSKPVTEIQTATRDAFELLTPLKESLLDYSKGVTAATNTFIRENRKLVGNVGLLYNFFGMDVFQQAFGLMEGTASAMGKTVGFIFSLKGLLLGLTGGALYLLHDRVNEIRQAFNLNGIIAAADTAIVILFEKISAMLSGTAMSGSGFFPKMFQSIVKAGTLAFQLLRKHAIVPLINYLVRETLFYGDKFLVVLKNTVLPALGDVVTSITKVFSGVAGSLVSEILLAISDSVPAGLGGLFYNKKDAANTRDNIQRNVTNSVFGVMKGMGMYSRNAQATFSDGGVGDKLLRDTTKRLEVEKFMQSSGFQLDAGAAKMASQQALIAARADPNIKSGMTTVNTQLMPAAKAAVATAQAAAVPMINSAADALSDATDRIIDNIAPRIQEGIQNATIENKIYLDGKQLQAATVGKISNRAMAGGE
jgi:hypothetical protein